MEENIKKKLTKNWFKILQDMICSEIEELENKPKFKLTNWQRNKSKDEGGGEYRILENGKIFEKVGVNFSEVYGKFSEKFKDRIPGTKNDPSFWASGISVVMHMKNPHIPAMHFNTRYIHTSYGWFGGGMDVTPCFEDKNLKKWFHNELKRTCDRHNKKFYTLFDNENGNSYEIPVLDGTVGPDVLDITNLYKESGLFTYDPGFTSTASCKSKITYIDGEQGILRHRG